MEEDAGRRGGDGVDSILISDGWVAQLAISHCITRRPGIKYALVNKFQHFTDRNLVRTLQLQPVSMSQKQGGMYVEK